MPPPEARRIGSRRHLRADAHDDAGHMLVAGRALDHGALLVRVVHDAAYAAKRRAEERQADGRIAFRRRDEDRFVRKPSRTVPGVIVAIAEEEHVVERARRLRQVVDERRTRRPLGIEPREFVGEGMCFLEDLARAPAEVEWLTFPGHRKASHGDAVDGLEARLQLVAPADVVAGAGCDDFDLGVPGEALGDIARVQLGAAVDVSAVALSDNREFHDSAGPPPVSPDAPDGSPASPPPES